MLLLELTAEDVTLLETEVEAAEPEAEEPLAVAGLLELTADDGTLLDDAADVAEPDAEELVAVTGLLSLADEGEEDEVLGCWRLLPTTGPNMLKDTFPQLLHGHPAPHQTDVWELSRFAVTVPKYESAGFGFSDIPVKMMQTLSAECKQW